MGYFQAAGGASDSPIPSPKKPNNAGEPENPQVPRCQVPPTSRLQDVPHGTTPHGGGGGGRGAKREEKSGRKEGGRRCRTGRNAARDKHHQINSNNETKKNTPEKPETDGVREKMEAGREPNKPVMAILADHLLVPSSTDWFTDIM